MSRVKLLKPVNTRISRGKIKYPESCCAKIVKHITHHWLRGQLKEINTLKTEGFKETVSKTPDKFLVFVHNCVSISRCLVEVSWILCR